MHVPNISKAQQVNLMLMSFKNAKSVARLHIVPVDELFETF